ncbi:monovalent cation/H+ antiporter complex subunit F [Agrococcus sp. ProA11]|uniref:monovalent cation/H+ antiporter complex subunit F n=1 Tax=Agrococcus chionoecetis TaxID=3153752 RepID=UPI0032617548
MPIVLMIAGVMLAVAATLSLVRIVRGPGPADRVVATDVLITTVAGALAVQAAITDESDTIVVILVLSLLAFSATVSMARFVAGRGGVVGNGPARGGADPSEGDAPADAEGSGR